MKFNPQKRPLRAFAPQGWRTPSLFFLLILATLFLLFLIAPVHAPNQTDYSIYNLTAFPERVAEHMQIDLFASEMLCCGIGLLLGVIPTTIITRSKKASWIPELGVTLVLLGFFIAVGWLNVFFIVAFCFVIALLFAGKMRDFVTGHT